MIGLAIVLLFKNSSELAQKFKPNLKHFAFTVILLVLSLSMMNRQIDFLYWQF